MYNLLISGSKEDWEGQRFEMDISRILEYTDDEIKAKFSPLTHEGLATLISYPCLFVYENGCDKPPKFGWIKSAKKRQNKIFIDYDLLPVTPFLTEEQLQENALNLDIGRKFELHRTHWAVKDVDLAKELKSLNIQLPGLGNQWSQKIIDINTHRFEVALSFPGDARSLVSSIVEELDRKMKPHQLFYDFKYQSQLARPSLDILLQDIYSRRSKLIVVFLSSNYERKQWCGVEFRAIREIIMKQHFDRVMFIKVDDGPVNGIFSNDGYIDSRLFSAGEIANFILERSHLQAIGDE
jgi:hypothetical protein